MSKKSSDILKRTAEILLRAENVLFLLLILVDLSIILRYTLIDRAEISGRVLLGAALWLLVLGAIYQYSHRVPHKAVWGLMLCVAIALQIVYVYGVCGTLNSDAPAIVIGAYQLAAGNELPQYIEIALYRFPNNIPIVEVLTALFKLWRPASLEQVHLPLALLCAALSDLAVFFIYKTVRLCRGKRAALVALLFSIALISVAEPSTIFYTDILGLWTLPAAAYLYVYLHTPRAKAFTNRRRIVLWCLMGGILAYGVWVKPQIVVGVIAGVIVLVLSKLFRAARKGSGLRYAVLSFVGCSLVLSFLSNVAMFGIAHVRDIEQNKMSLSHFIAMGLNKGTAGCWNAEDVSEGTSILGQAQKEEFFHEKISQRLHDLGPGGLLRHLERKLQISLRSGVIDWKTMWRGDLVHHGPVATAVQEYTLRGHDGTTRFFEPAVQSCYILVFVLVLLGPGMAYARKEDFAQPRAKLAQVAQISWIGITLFLFLLECNDRYLFAMRPALIFLAVASLDDALDAMPRCAKKQGRPLGG